MPLTIARCSSCRDSFHDDGEGWDLCPDCRAQPVALNVETFVCMNCGADVDDTDPERLAQFCSADCAKSALREIVAYGRFD